MRCFSRPLRQVAAGAFGIFCLISAGCDGADDTQTSAHGPARAGCNPDVFVETDGLRRLALIVGVGEYKNKKVPDLEGAPNDARRFYDLLTGKHGYGFPKENVCLLLDEDATTEGFKQAFDEALVRRARKGDVAVLFYAGHGSQRKDKNGDEPDEWDETFMFHDARTGGIRDLVDDQFNQMLARLHGKTEHVTVVLDSCNSGTATRGPEAGTAVPRFFEPEAVDASVVTEGTGDGGGGWAPEAMPGLVVFSAATDSNPALERGGAASSPMPSCRSWDRSVPGP